VGDHEDETQTLHLSVLEFEILLFETKPTTLRKVEGSVGVVVDTCLEGTGEAREEDRAAGGWKFSFGMM
jgi:hypothetical protein